MFPILYRIVSDDSRAAYREMLDVEAVLLRTLIGARVTDLHIVVDRMQRRVLGTKAGDWSIGEVRLSAEHRVAIV